METWVLWKLKCDKLFKSKTKKDEKEMVKARRKWLGEIGAVPLDVRTEGSLKPKNKRSNPLKKIISGSSKSSAPDSQEDAVYIYI